MGIDPISIGITIALNLAMMALTASRTIEGPRLTDLEASVADYGTPIPTVFGIDRIECSAFFLEPIKERKKKRKTKGGKYKEYTYYGTAAYIVADHQITSYRRIWLDRHLAYDAVNGESVIKVSGAASSGGKGGGGEQYELEHFVRLYLGTADQDVDPRMQAFIEAEDGPDTCPAFLNVAYIFFEDFPLEKFGNRYMQVGAEIAGISGGSGENLSVTMDSDTVDFNTSEDGLDPAYWDGDLFYVSQSGRYVVGSNISSALPGWLSDLSSGTPELVYKVDWYNTDYFDESLNEYFSFLPRTVDDEGTVWGQSGARDGEIVAIDIDDPQNPTVEFTWTNNGGQSQGLRVQKLFAFTMPDSSIRILMLPQADSENGNRLYFLGTKGLSGLTQFDSGGSWYPNYAFQDDLGDIWLTGTPRTIAIGTDRVHFERVTDITGSSPYDSQTVTGLPFIDTTGGGAFVNVPHAYGFFSDGSFVGGWGGTQANIYATAYLINVPLDNSNTFTSVDISATPVYLASAEQFPIKPYFTPNQERFFVVPLSDSRLFREVSIADLTFINSYDIDVFAVPNDQGHRAYHWIDSLSAFIHQQQRFLDVDFFIEQGELFLLRLGGGGDLVLATILRYFSEKVSLAENDDFDVSDTEDIPIYGCHFMQGQVKSFIGPLCDLFDVDCRQHEFLVEFIKRDREPQATIETTQMVRNGDQPLYDTWMIAESDVARRLFLTFADPNADFQPNTAVAQRNLQAVDSVKELPIDMRTTVLHRDEAKQRAEQLLRRFWYGRLQSKFSYSYIDIANECGDKINVDFDGEIVTMKIDKIRIGAGYILDLELERDAPSLATVSNSVGAEAVGIPTSQVLIVGPTQGFILDIPQPYDAFEQGEPYLLVAAAPADQDDFWAGADIAYSTTGNDADFVSGWDGVSASEAATWGVVNDVLPSADPEIIDWGSVIEVTVQHGELLSTTEGEAIADRAVNLALIGDELVQFIDAQIIDSVGESATYQLQGFIRAVQGTEWAMDSHVAGEQFVLLDTVKRHTVGSSEIGVTRYYQPNSVGIGDTVGDIIPRYFTDEAQRPLSPVNVHCLHDPDTGSFFLDWTRRSRINGSLNGADIPLGETYEEYRLVIGLDSGTEREVVLTEPEYEYTEAMQIEDLGSPISFIFGTCATALASAKSRRPRDHLRQHVIGGSMNLPLSGLEEWLGPQSSPWLIVNKFMRIYEGMAERASIEDRDLTAPPGSCNNGARYLVKAPATGLWTGYDDQLAIALGTNASNGWYFIPIEREGFELYVRDETLKLIWQTGAWVPVAIGTVAANDVNYTPAAEGFYAGTVEEALDQLFAMVEGFQVLAENISYIPTDPGFYSSNVRDALDEIIANFANFTAGGGGTDTDVITAADSASVATSESRANTAYGDLATVGPSVTLVTGTSVIVTIDAQMIPVANCNPFMAVEVSGATTLAAADVNAIETTAFATAYIYPSRTFKITGLTPGSNTFTAKYKSNTGGSVAFAKRDITVLAL